MSSEGISAGNNGVFDNEGRFYNFNSYYSSPLRMIAGLNNRADNDVAQLTITSLVATQFERPPDLAYFSGDYAGRGVTSSFFMGLSGGPTNRKVVLVELKGGSTTDIQLHGVQFTTLDQAGSSANNVDACGAAWTFQNRVFLAGCRVGSTPVAKSYEAKTYAQAYA